MKTTPKIKLGAGQRREQQPCSLSSDDDEEIQKELALESYDKSIHDHAWEKNFVVPIGREMKKRGIGYMVMILRDDGKLAYVLNNDIPENVEPSRGDSAPTP